MYKIFITTIFVCWQIASYSVYATQELSFDKRILPKKSSFSEKNLSNLESSQAKALMDSLLPQDHPWRKANFKGNVYVKKHTTEDGFSFWEKENGLHRFLARFAVTNIMQALKLEGLILPEAYIVIRDAKTMEEVTINNLEDLQAPGLHAYLLVEDVSVRGKNALNLDAVKTIAELLWYVHLDLHPSNVYINIKGEAILIDCEDKGEHWVSNIQKFWQRFALSPAAIDYINENQLPQLRRCVAQMIAKHIRLTEAKDYKFSILDEGPDKGLIESLEFPNNGWFELPVLSSADSEEFGCKEFGFQSSALLLAFNVLDPGYWISVESDQLIVRTIKEVRSSIRHQEPKEEKEEPIEQSDEETKSTELVREEYPITKLPPFSENSLKDVIELLYSGSIVALHTDSGKVKIFYIGDSDVELSSVRIVALKLKSIPSLILDGEWPWYIADDLKTHHKKIVDNRAFFDKVIKYINESNQEPNVHLLSL